MQKNNKNSEKKNQWQKPRVTSLSGKKTRTGIGGSQADFLNYDPTSPTATNTNGS